MIQIVRHKTIIRQTLRWDFLNNIHSTIFFYIDDPFYQKHRHYEDSNKIFLNKMIWIVLFLFVMHNTIIREMLKEQTVLNNIHSTNNLPLWWPLFMKQQSAIKNIFEWNNFNRQACIRHLCRKTTVLSCHRLIINTGVEKMNKI